MTAQGVHTGGIAAAKLLFPGGAQQVKKDGGQSFESFLSSDTTEKGGVRTKEETAVTGLQKLTRQTAEKVETILKRTERAAVKKEAPAVKEEEIPETAEAAEAFAALLITVKQTVMELLGMTEEEFNGTLEEIGKALQDMLDEDTLRQFYLQANGADAADFLTSETLLGGLETLLESVEALLQESGLSEELLQQALLSGEFSKMPLEAEQPEQSQRVTTPEEPLAVQKQKQADFAKEESSLQEEEVSDSKHSTISVEVTRISEGNAGKSESSMEFSEQTRPKEVRQTEPDFRQTGLAEEFLNHLAAGITEETGLEAGVESIAEWKEIAAQIVEQIKVVITPEQTNMELQLNPEHLGRVNLTVTEKEGMMTAQFVTQTQAAKEAIESQMLQLREALQNQGLKVDAIEVTVASFSFDQNGQAGQSTGQEKERQRRNVSFEATDLEEEAAPLFQTPDYLGQETSSVDYSA